MNNTKPVVVIPQSVIDKINYLHQIAPLNKEWSGVLIFTDVKNNEEDILPQEIYVEDIVPMDIGTSYFTDFNLASPQMNDYVLKNFDKKFYTGMIHTHHSMEAYFSGTDLDELKTNSKSYQYYLSVIVNYKMDVVAKIGIQTKTEVTTSSKEYKYTLKGFVLKEVKKTVKDKFSCMEIDCDVSLERSVESDFKNSIQLMKEELKKKNLIMKKNLEKNKKKLTINNQKKSDVPTYNPWDLTFTNKNKEKDLVIASEYVEYLQDLLDQFSDEIKNEELKLALNEIF